MRLGIDIGGSHIASGIVLEDGTLLGKETRDMDWNFPDTFESSEKEKLAINKILKTIDEEVWILLEKYNYKKEDICMIGIAVPGNPTETSIKNVVNLHIKEFNILDALKEKYNCNIKIKNDGKCAGLAEKKYGNLKDYDDCVFLCIGTGVGSAAFINGKLLEPKRAPGFEFGHMIIEKGGANCKCGKQGCFETYASMKRFKEKVVKELKLDENVPSEEVQDYIRKSMTKVEEVENNEITRITNEDGETEKVEQLVDEYIENVAIGVSNIINILEPEAICFGGSFSYYEDIFLPMLNVKIKQYIFNKDLEYKLICAKLKNDAGIIGAAGL